MDYTNMNTQVLIDQRDELIEMIDTSNESKDDPMNLLMHDNLSDINKELAIRGEAIMK